MTPKLALVILAMILAALSYWKGPLLGVSVIILAASHLVP